ncbi:MAG TPA: hypothetical protein VGO59_16730 [Verrucomicrobiae bacterium]|jgi:hypothetical protein
MTARRFFISLGIGLAILAGCNVLIHLAARRTQRQHLLALLDNIPPATECLFLGNSLIEAGCDADAFHSAWPGHDAPRALNIGLGATTPVEHYLILKQALRRESRIKYIVYGFFDDQLQSPSRGDWSDLVGNRAFSYYFPNEAAALYAPGSWFEKWRMQFISRIPMFAERSSIWDKVDSLRRRADGIGMPSQKMNRYGRVTDFSALEAADVPSFESLCNSAIGDKGGFSPAVQGILQLAARHGATVFLVEMPMSPSHRKTFYSLAVWAKMRARNRELAAQHHAVYIPASDWVRDSGDFDDAVHLNTAGARAFSDQLAVALAGMTSKRDIAGHGALTTNGRPANVLAAAGPGAPAR